MLKRSFNISNPCKGIERLVMSYLQAIDSPRALTVWLLFKYLEHDQLLGLDVDPHRYEDPTQFHRDYLATSFLKKCKELNTSFVPRNEALAKFHEAEVMCRETNTRIRTRTPRGVVHEVIHRASENIRDLLPSVDKSLTEDILSLGAWGAGVTSSCKGKFLSHYDKLAAKPQATPALLSAVGSSFLDSFPSWSAAHPNGVSAIEGNTIATVPKNAKTDRMIAVEPSVNSFLQRGVGKIIRKQLFKWGINLHSQSLNQTMAREGSVNGSFATIDLSSASDTMAQATVELLLPSEWFSLLSYLRSPYYKDSKGDWHRYHKHSSMGNGYTFELETLIFASVVRAVYSVLGLPIKGRYIVYGDDIIVSSEAAPLVIETLEYLGFKTNLDKTFLSSHFRESCGADWFKGVQCRPFFLRSMVDVIQVMNLANWLRTDAPAWMDISKPWKAAFLTVPSDWRIRGPIGYSDYYFFANWYEIDPSAAVLNRRPYGPFVGYRVSLPVFIPHSTQVSDDHSSLAAALWLQESHSSFSTNVEKTQRGFEVTLDVNPWLRKKTAKESGKWVRRPVLFTEDWPLVRDF